MTLDLNDPITAVGIGIACSIAGAILFETARWTWLRLQERRATLTGDWTQIIFDPADAGGTPIKSDCVRCRQRGEIITANIKRREPVEQANRNWRFSGRYREGVIFGHFWSLDLSNLSYGTIFLRRTGSGRYSGFYIRSQQVVQRWNTAKVELKTIPVEWRHTVDTHRDESTGES